MDDPWNVRTGRHARIMGGYIGSNITPPPYLSCYRERTMTTYYATPRSFFIIIAGHRPVSNERPPFVRNYKLVAPFRPESKPNLTENIYVPLIVNRRDYPNQDGVARERACRLVFSRQRRLAINLLSEIRGGGRDMKSLEFVPLYVFVGGVASVRDYPAM